MDKTNPGLTKEILEKTSGLFGAIEEYRIADDAISHAIAEFPLNDSKVGVYTKAVLINTFYRTVIWDIRGIAQHILKKRVDIKLRSGDITVVDDIRSGHEVTATRGGGERKEIDFYSFATKYAHFHKPEAYPLYDYLVMRLLSKANSHLEFYRKFTQPDLKDYRTYKSVVDAFRQKMEIANWDYKKLDQGLWMYAKYCYRKDKLPEDIVEQLAEIMCA